MLDSYESAHLFLDYANPDLWASRQKNTDLQLPHAQANHQTFSQHCHMTKESEVMKTRWENISQGFYTIKTNFFHYKGYNFINPI